MLQIAYLLAGDHDLSAQSGCWQNDCKNSDKFIADSPVLCARTCSELGDCTHWTLPSRTSSFAARVERGPALWTRWPGWPWSRSLLVPHSCGLAVLQKQKRNKPPPHVKADNHENSFNWGVCRLRTTKDSLQFAEFAAKALEFIRLLGIKPEHGGDAKQKHQCPEYL